MSRDKAFRETLPSLQNSLLGWYYKNKRDLPWRGQTDPYKVLLSEVLLQQTRVDQAIPYYQRFLKEFPTLEALGKASLEAVLKVWQGAGYYARARNLHRLAQTLVGTSLPHPYLELLKLPGLGPYTAAAVASIAFGEAVAVVDANVRRVISRLKGWENPTSKALQATADQFLDHQAPGEWNQAMMELGATICTAKNPLCLHCPINKFCQGKENPRAYPVSKERKQKAMQAVALVLLGPEGVYLVERQGRALGGLWGFPSDEGTNLEPLISRLLGARGPSPLQPEYVGVVTHAFTHRRLRVQVYQSQWDGPGFNPDTKPLSQLDRKILALVESAQRSGQPQPLF